MPAESLRSVPLARREIVDLVYRCCRVAGIEAGVAHRCAENVAHGQVHRGGSVQEFLDAIGQDLPGLDRFVGAADSIELAEAATDSRVQFTAPVALAAVSASLWEAADRGFVAVDVTDVDQGSRRVETIGFKTEDLAWERRHASAAREHDAGMNGVPVDPVQLRQLENHAAGYLVAESDVDAAVGET